MEASTRPVRAFCSRMAERIRETRNNRASGSSSSNEPLLNKILPASVQGLMSKFKNDPPNAAGVEVNPIYNIFDVGPEVATAGHLLIWRIHQGYRKMDRKEVSIFICDKRLADKMYKSKKKETVLDRIRANVAQLIKWRHPKMLYVVHGIEESMDTIAFASEPVIASLYNILSFEGSLPIPHKTMEPFVPLPASQSPTAPSPPNFPPPDPEHPYEYKFCELQLCYGIMQMIDSLHFIHYQAKMVHRNVCPEVIIVTKRGTWKLFGLEFAEPFNSEDPMDPISVPPWSVKVARIAQPNLDYMAPEVQANAHCTILSDIYSLGLILCTIYNRGKTIVSANQNPQLFMKQSETLDKRMDEFLAHVPETLREAITRMVAREPSERPTSQLLPLIHYFKDNGHDIVLALQALDMIQFKDRESKKLYYRQTLANALPKIAREMRWMTIWPYVSCELTSQDISPFVFIPIIWLVNDSTQEEFDTLCYPAIRNAVRNMVNDHKKFPACVLAVENLHYIIQKCSDTDVSVDLLPLLYKALEDPSYQMQMSALLSLQTASDLVHDRSFVLRVIPKLKQIIEKTPGDVKMMNLVLGAYEKNLKKLDKNQVTDQVIPGLLALRLQDPKLVNRTFLFFKELVSDPKYAISTTMMATKLIPSLCPVAVTKGLNLEQFSVVMELLYQMMNFIDAQQRIMITCPPPPTPLPEQRKANHQKSSDSVAPPFTIPDLRVSHRKTSSAEEMARKNSYIPPPATTTATTSTATTSTAHAAEVVTESFKKMVSGSGLAWIFNPSSNENEPNNESNNGGSGIISSHYLRVASVFTNRRLSDNTLTTPKIRVAPSCASSPGATPGGSNSVLPARRHSSIGPQERRGSTVNLSPPTAVHNKRGRPGGSGSSLSVPSPSHGGSMPNTSSSVPHLLTSSLNSIRSRRSSAGVSASNANSPAHHPPAGGSRGSQGAQGIISQLRQGMARRLPATPNSSPLRTQWNNLQSSTTASYRALRRTATTAVRKCPSLNISLVK